MILVNLIMIYFVALLVEVYMEDKLSFFLEFNHH